MGKINAMRVILGGLLAGLLINMSEFLLNGLVLKDDWPAAMASLNRPPMSASTVGVFVITGFFFGIILCWIYAGIRPRFGAGPKTAILAGFIAWLIGYLGPSVSIWAMGLFPSKLIWVPLVWGFVEVMIAALAGGWLYKEA
jgi:hypothetical protein